MNGQQPVWYPGFAVPLQRNDKPVDVPLSDDGTETDKLTGSHLPAGAHAKHHGNSEPPEKRLLPAGKNERESGQWRQRPEMAHATPRAHIPHIEVIAEHIVEEPPEVTADTEADNSSPASLFTPVLAGTLPLDRDLLGEPAAHQITATLAKTLAQDGADPIKQGEVKVLRMKLKPEELGDVEVVLRHTGGETHIHISVSRPAAAEALRRDLGILEDRLGPLLAATVPPAITISVQAENQTQAAHLGQENQTGNSPGNFGTQADAQRGGSSSRGKEDLPFLSKTEDRDAETLPLQRNMYGLVV